MLRAAITEAVKSEHVTTEELMRILQPGEAPAPGDTFKKQQRSTRGPRASAARCRPADQRQAERDGGVNGSSLTRYTTDS